MYVWKKWLHLHLDLLQNDIRKHSHYIHAAKRQKLICCLVHFIILRCHLSEAEIFFHGVSLNNKQTKPRTSYKLKTLFFFQLVCFLFLRHWWEMSVEQWVDRSVTDRRLVSRCQVWHSGDLDYSRVRTGRTKDASQIIRNNLPLLYEVRSTGLHACLRHLHCTQKVLGSSLKETTYLASWRSSLL